MCIELPKSHTTTAVGNIESKDELAGSGVPSEASLEPCIGIDCAIHISSISLPKGHNRHLLYNLNRGHDRQINPSTQEFAPQDI
ncbi:hypothetical protein RRG08_000715 [Elysia crispata]|uniref:Uncharacterized protein n=1 Tax=Elysia crispata TaxID=231223 RepID=A0AAE1E5R3_9GAST|nr:hypothetical protein RRG08_000715 [Elysia crispata]